MEKMILDDCYVMGGAKTITLDNSSTRKLTGKLQILQKLQTTTRKVAVWAVFEAGFSWKTSIDYRLTRRKRHTVRGRTTHIDTLHEQAAFAVKDS